MSKSDHPKVLVPIVNGTEELEAITIIDTLKRAGCDVTVVSVSDEGGLTVHCAMGTMIIADKLSKDCKDVEFDMIAMPGGPGSRYLKECPYLSQILKRHEEKKKWIGGICGAPCNVLKDLGLLEGKEATCDPSKIKDLPKGREDHVVVSDNVITSQGPGTALEFSLKLVEQLFDKSKADEVANAMVFTPMITS